LLFTPTKNTSLRYDYFMESQKTIGIVGGGQLGRMLTLAAIPLGFKVIVINPSKDSPAHEAGAEEIIADLYDKKALKELARRSDYITVEIEHLDASELQKLADKGAKINPNPETIALIQDKLAQKEYLQKAKIPVADFIGLTDQKSAEEALTSYGGKMLIKTRHGAYDGRGNMVIKSRSDIEKAFKLFKDKKLYAEKYVPFVKELAVMVARSVDNEIATYDIVQTIHERNICLEVIAPAEADAKAIKEAKKVAKDVAKLLKGAGMFGIEMFLTDEGKILVNEIAPRVHNSGHYTMDANRTSQFEQHIRAIAGLPLGDSSMVVPAAVMINILGERDGPTKLTGLSQVLKNPGVSVHIYGKSPTKVDRKMGHINATAKSIKEARAKARKARRQLSI
jgi:5-(carboxyamino)imidazole ribonucleotide synthase